MTSRRIGRETSDYHLEMVANPSPDEIRALLQGMKNLWLQDHVINEAAALRANGR